MKIRVADMIVQTLVERGITDCFAVVGGGAMHLDNALGLNHDIHKIFNHHEQACAMAADAYARVSGKMAAVCVTSGPGATNAITGVMGAWQDSLPMLILSGQVRYAISAAAAGLPLRYRGIQEFAIIPSVKNMTKYAVMVTDPLAVRREVNKAVDIAMSGRRGPVWLDIPMDVQSAVVETQELYPDEPSVQAPQVSQAQVSQVLARLRTAKRPVILAGYGIVSSGCLESFRRFAGATGLPVVASSLSPDTMYSDNTRYYGTCGTVGPRAGNFIIQSADTILSLGCSLGFKTTGFQTDCFAPDAEILVVDVDENEVKKPGIRHDMFLHGTLESFFRLSTDTQTIPVDAQWLHYCDALKKEFSVFAPAEDLSMQERVCAYWFWKKFQELAPENTICALGNNTANSAKYQVGISKAHQRVLGNRNCGSMGYDLPAAIGAAVALGREIICVTGDGSIMMNLQELQTIRYYQLPIKIIIFENDGYNAIRQTSKNFFGGFLVGCDAGSGVSCPVFEKVAAAFDVPYHCCQTNEEVTEGLKWLFQSKGTVLLEVKQRLDDPVAPKVMSRQLPDGTMATPALQDMYPFLDKEEVDQWMPFARRS